jgi:hypothetical protein
MYKILLFGDWDSTIFYRIITFLIVSSYFGGKKNVTQKPEHNKFIPNQPLITVFPSK